MIREYEGYLIYEADEEEPLWEECAEFLRHMPEGILPVSTVRKNSGQAFFWDNRGLMTFEESMPEADPLQWLRRVLRFLEILQMVHKEDRMSLDAISMKSDRIYVNPITEAVYVVVFPVRRLKENQSENWENRVKKLCEEFLDRNAIASTGMGNSIRVLLKGKMVAPENLSRNLQMLIKSRYAAVWAEMEEHELEREPGSVSETILKSEKKSVLDERKEAVSKAAPEEEKIPVSEPEPMEEDMLTHSGSVSEEEEVPAAEPEEEIKEVPADEPMDVPVAEAETTVLSANMKTQAEKIELDFVPRDIPPESIVQKPKIFTTIPREDAQMKLKGTLLNQGERESQEERTEELNWEDQMRKNAEKDSNAFGSAETEPTVQQRVLYQKQVDVSEHVISGRPEYMESPEEKRKNTQVLRRNVLASSDDSGSANGFASAKPVRLNQQEEVRTIADDTQPMGARELHLVSFGNAEDVDLCINKPYFVIGKMASRVDGVINYTSTISRVHCAIIQEADGVYIEDLGSANHTFVNERQLQNQERVKIETNDVIRLAQEKFSIIYRSCR